MKRSVAGIRIAPFLIGIICFILPFLSISCDGNKLMSFTGVQLVTGAELKDSLSGESRRIPSDPMAVIALLALVAGLCLAVSNTRRTAIGSALAAAAATLSMLFLKFRMDAQIMKHASGMPIAADYQLGFWLVCLASVLGLIMSVMRVENGRESI